MLPVICALLCLVLTWNAALHRQINELKTQMDDNVELISRLKAGYGSTIERMNSTLHSLASGVKTIQEVVKANTGEVDVVMQQFSDIHLRMAAYENSIPTADAPTESVMPNLMDLSEYLETEELTECSQPEEVANENEPSEEDSDA